jgi:zinc protease
MLSGLVAATLLAVSLAGPGRAAESAVVLDIAHLQDQTLDNGLRVIIKSEPYWRAVALGAVIRSGSKDDPADASGAAHLVEHLLFEPATPGKSLSVEVENLGGFVNAQTGTDSTQITLAVASQFAPDLMPRLAATIFGAKFTEEQVAASKSIILRELQDRDSTVLGRLDALTSALAFTKHPYGQPITGTADSVTKLTVKDAQDFYDKHYVPGNVALIAVGDQDPTAFFALARQHFGGLPATPRAAEALPVEPPQTAARTQVVQLPVPNTVMRYAWPGPGIASQAEVCAMDLIYTALDRGETSLLNRNLEQKNLALSSQVGFLTQKYPGLFTVTVITTPDQELPARQALLAAIADLRDKQFNDEELAYLKKLLYADYAFENQSYPDQVGTLAFYEAILNYRFATTYLSACNAVTAAQIQAAARKYLREDNYNLVIFRPQAGPAEGNDV